MCLGIGGKKARRAKNVARSIAQRRKLPHSVHIPELEIESVKDLDPTTMDRLAIVEPHIYTDGSRIEGKIVVALAEWQKCSRFIGQQRELKMVTYGMIQSVIHFAFCCIAKGDILDIVVKGREMTPFLAQSFMGHSRFAQYAYKFKLKNPSYCTCAADKTQVILHVLEQYSIPLKEYVEIKTGTSVRIVIQNFSNYSVK
ncbi:hypothetical protein EVAR_94520_1 [Eumeta japonica]|uniref:Uncharacterized protein n=1 Tax=Eumeta variegata TaxID=151549 RepID=A0A4C1UW46_EUMVA|nr:hypothetical protein EVAR_94520_1 [Eumeta japonica]